MATRLAALPRSLKLSLLPPSAFPRARHASRWAHDPAFSSFFTRTPAHPRITFKRSTLWLIPVAGGLTLYLLPRPQSSLPEVFASPTLIPCTAHNPRPEPFIFSPSEHDSTLLGRIRCLLQDHVWEPILTARRFVHLFFLFMPLILSSPMLLVGQPEPALQGDRWGAVWWYDFLVAQMERAGPTFIKVCCLPSLRRPA